ncbi:MAG: hypothetical protein H3C62_00900 [Gemmatimonadaceae bacterium]|nr:hypothetical protein [Gemmatimonadaceae bacterium]
MRQSPAILGHSQWPAVCRLLDRWAALPPTLWQLLIDADAIAGDSTPLGPPQTYEEWVVRDLVETAWWMATRRHSLANAAWAARARQALVRAARRLLEPTADPLPQQSPLDPTARPVSHR